MKYIRLPLLNWLLVALMLFQAWAWSIKATNSGQDWLSWFVVLASVGTAGFIYVIGIKTQALTDQTKAIEADINRMITRMSTKEDTL